MSDARALLAALPDDWREQLQIINAAVQIPANAEQITLLDQTNKALRVLDAIDALAEAQPEALDVPALGPPERPGWIGVRLRDAFWRDDYYITGKYNHHHPDHTTVAHDYREEACRYTLIEPIYPYDRNFDDGATKADPDPAARLAGDGSGSGR
jgi:hypothetical protein